MGIDLVVFDLAGTTVRDNNDVHRVLQSALKNYGVAISIAEANDVMGIPKRVAIEKLLKLRNYPDTSAELITEIHELFVAQMVDFYQTDSGVVERTGVSDTFAKLKSHGIKVGVDTGFDRAITDVVLGRMKWREKGLLDVSVASDEVARGRPHPELIFKAMELTGVNDVARVAKVGDTPSDLLEGTSAGCSVVVGITTGATGKAQLSAEPHTHLIEEIPEVLRILHVA